MSVNSYKKFLDNYNSDKIIKKFITLKQEEKEREIFRKIGLDEYFQPVTSVIKKELEPFHNLINKKTVVDNEGGREIGRETLSEEKEIGRERDREREIGRERDIIGRERDRERETSGETSLGETSEETLSGEDEYFSPKKYEPTKNFLSFEELNKNYSEKERRTEKYLEYWKKIAKNIYDIDFDADTNFTNLEDKELDNKLNNLNNIKKSSNAQIKYNENFYKINNDIDDMIEKIRDIKKERKEEIIETKPKINYNPYEKLSKYNNLDKNSEKFAIRWLQISREDLGYKQEQKDFDSYTLDELVEYRDKLNKIHSSSSKRTSNNFIKFYDIDVKNQLKDINIKIKSQKGSGIKNGSNEVIYYNNPQQLIDRLRLLVGSKRAGNTNPEIDNEVIGISDELVKKGLIMNEEYTRFMNKNFINY